MIVRHPDGLTHVLQPPLDSTFPASLPTSVPPSLAPSSAHALETLPVIDLQTFQDSFADQRYGHTKVHDSKSAIAADKHASPSRTRRNVTKADCLNRNRGEIEGINIVKTHDESVAHCSKRDIDHQQDDNDDESALFPC